MYRRQLWKRIAACVMAAAMVLGGGSQAVFAETADAAISAESAEYAGMDPAGAPSVAEAVGEPSAGEDVGEPFPVGSAGEQKQDAPDQPSSDHGSAENLGEGLSEPVDDEIIADESETDTAQLPADALPASEGADEAAAISADGSDLIEAIEVVEEAPSLASEEETVETVKMEIGKKLTLHFTENSRKVLTFSPEQTGTYILRRTEVQERSDSIDAGLYEDGKEESIDDCTFYGSDDWTVRLEKGVQYRFELVSAIWNNGSFDADFTLIEAPEIASLEWGYIPDASSVWGKGVMDVTTLLESGRLLSLYVTYTDSEAEPYELWNWDVDEKTGAYMKTTSSGEQLCIRLLRKDGETPVAVDSLLDAGDYQFRVYQIDPENGDEKEWEDLRKDVMVMSGVTPGVTTLETGKNYELSCDEDEYYSVFSFTPAVSGEYQLHAKGKEDLIAYLYGPDKRFLRKDETEGMISLSYDLRKGVTYYYLVRNYFLSEQVTGVTVNLEATDVVDIAKAVVSSIADSPWNAANVSDMMRQIRLNVSYGGTYEGTETITEWQPDAENDISYYSVRLSCGATIRMELYQGETQVSVDQMAMEEGSYQIRFYSEVYVDHNYEKTELEEIRQNITVSGSAAEKEFDKSGVESLSLGAGEAAIYSFTPDKDAWYLLYTEGGAAVEVSLYDENNTLLEDLAYADSRESFAYNLKGNTTYRYKISGYNGNAVNAVKLHLIPAVTVESVELVTPPSRTSFAKGTDKTVSAAGAKLRLTYVGGIDPEELEFDSSNTMTDSHKNTVDFYVYINDDGEPGSPDTTDVDDLGAGDYFLGAEVTQCTGAILGPSRTKIYVPIKVTGQGSASSSHSHSWGEWTVTKPATVFASGTRSRKCTAGDGATDTQTIPRLAPVLKLAANSIALKEGQSTTKLKVTEMAAGDSLASVVSSDPKLLKVSGVKANGTFKLKALKTSKKAVKLTVTLKSGKSGTVKVKLQSKKVVTKKIKGVKKKLTLKVKKKATLTPVVTPITMQDKLKFTSSNKKVATVSKKGVVTAKKAGTAKITVQSGGKKVTCTVTVKK